ncbi:MAG: cellulose biosynthesis cyclic di-GMP-binding regulatory protein BcsB [Candidatus Faecousia sp.]|nr:cellulose biosynthesis cyclic di-GMP-binding regulatory protein BcsB [Candidatus Faecousia sp.]
MGMKKPVSKLIAWALALVLVAGLFPAALAGEAEREEAAFETVEEPTQAARSEDAGEKTALLDARQTMELVTDRDPADADAPLTRLDIPEAAHFTDFSYEENVLFSGIYKTHRYYFQVDEYWDCQYAYAQIEVELSQLIQDVPASLTFMINNTPVATYKMDYRSGRAQVFFVEIPLEYLEEGYNAFDITGYVRLYDDDGCIDDFSGANWICVRESSFIQVGYEAMNPNRRISAYPYPFISSLDESGSSTEILVSDVCAPEELAAALMLRADLASETKLEDRIILARLSDSEAEKQQRVIVALRSNLSDRYRAAAEEALNGGDLSDRAMIRFLEEGDANVLLLTSDSGDALMEAARMLMDESRVSQEKSDLAFVQADASALIRAQIGSTMETGRLTLDSLLDSGLSFVGPFHQVGDIYLPFSGGYVLAESGMVDLKFRYSENLDFSRSMITVYWGNVPVGSKRLTRENAGGDSLSFTMPDDVVGTYAGKITIAFDLELPDLFCTPRMSEMPWAYITSDSSFYLPVGVGANYTLSQRPYPFEVSSRFNDLNVVIPEHITAAELDALGRMVALYGEDPSPYGDLMVSYAGSLTQEDKNHNLMVLGNFGDNALLQELNDKLHFQYSDTGSNFRSNDVMVLSDSYARSITTLQLLPSPYAEGRAVLVVGALDDDGMVNLRQFLADSKNVWKLEKDTVLIDSEQEVRTFELAEKKAAVSTPLLKRMLDSNEDTAVFTLVSTAVMLLFLLAGILILIRIYWRQKK